MFIWMVAESLLDFLQQQLGEAAVAAIETVSENSWIAGTMCEVLCKFTWLYVYRTALCVLNQSLDIQLHWSGLNVARVVPELDECDVCMSQARIQDLMKGAQLLRPKIADVAGQSQTGKASYVGPGWALEAFGYFTVQICILPYSWDSFSLISNIYMDLASVGMSMRCTSFDR